MATVEFYQDGFKDWRWKRWDDNGELISHSSEGFRNRNDCEANAAGHVSKDHTEKYIDDAGKYRWRVISANSKIVAASHCGWDTEVERDVNLAAAGYQTAQSLA